MKSKKSVKKLNLNTVTVSNLNGLDLESIRGGATLEQTELSFDATHCRTMDTECALCRPTAPCSLLCIETDWTRCVCVVFTEN